MLIAKLGGTVRGVRGAWALPRGAGSAGAGRAAGAGAKARQGVQGLGEGLGREGTEKRTNITSFGYFGSECRDEPEW